MARKPFRCIAIGLALAVIGVVALVRREPASTPIPTTLNGVTDPEALRWPASRSDARVVEVLRGEAFDVWLHEDGTHSSTIWLEDSRTGERGAAAYVARPLEVEPEQILLGPGYVEEGLVERR